MFQYTIPKSKVQESQKAGAAEVKPYGSQEKKGKLNVF